MQERLMQLNATMARHKLDLVAAERQINSAKVALQHALDHSANTRRRMADVRALHLEISGEIEYRSWLGEMELQSWQA
jgi:hypothetical protein